jgi:molybdate transport system permease protein
VNESALPGMVALTLRVAAVATLVALLPAVALGYALARHRFRGRALVQALVALPMVLPPVAVGLGLLALFGRRGPLGALLAALGIEIIFSWYAAVLAAALVGFPLFARACEQAFAALDPRYERMARSLGASPLRAFARVSVPLAGRGILYGALLAFARGLGEFGATAIVAGILPGRTETLALGIWSRLQMGDEAGARALCVASFALALGAMLVAEVWLRRDAASPGAAARS